LQGYHRNFSNPFNQALGSSGKKGRSIAGQIPAREATGGGEGLAHEHQELKVRPGVGLGVRGGGRRWGSHGGRGGGEEELIGEGLSGEEGGQALVY
jgi:hypothetical protein